ncbi:DUF3667 domain-containing protein [Flavobacterium terrigena]|uniref:DUF3667 domain-containing protein n=1 Tax=Flavobacterium terrigena TaxID=402734 RepID=A0A1H6Q6M5_9FLAO|nr:DUF3667 domain-containing protein [Flavobacterium terrigena]SEI39461.1 Protein of unknown function [Flavobacterium terrigena]
MSHGKLREDTTCLNCGDEVTVRFCPTCGQENTETKKSFHYLFTHFIEDLVHYDNSFWKAIKYLLYTPATLSIIYLNGQRKKFMAPVKLFIFINFFAFFVFNAFVFHDVEDIVTTGTEYNDSYFNKKNVFNEQVRFIGGKRANNNSEKTWLDININDKMTKLNQKYTIREINKMMFNKAISNLPKWIFFFMPFFAFGLWLTHDKKKWWFFDHGIFTFHYFSTLLLILSFSAIISTLVGLTPYECNSWYEFAVFLILQIIFYKSYRKFYQESRIKTFLKFCFIYFFNFVMLFIIMLLALLHTVYIL